MTTRDEARLMIKSATRRAVKLAGFGNLVAQDLGVSEGLLSRWQSPHHDEIIRADLIHELERMGETRIITETLARMHDCVLAKADGNANGDPDVDDLLGLVGRSSELSASLSNALADRVVDAHESRALLAGIDQLRREIDRLDSKLNGNA